jgi:hypothetical protein
MDKFKFERKIVHSCACDIPLFVYRQSLQK